MCTSRASAGAALHLRTITLSFLGRTAREDLASKALLMVQGMALQVPKPRKQPTRRATKAAACKTEPASLREKSPPLVAENSPEKDSLPAAAPGAEGGFAGGASANAMETAKPKARLPDPPAPHEAPPTTCRREAETPAPQGGAGKAPEKKAHAQQASKAPNKRNARCPSTGAPQAPPPHPALANSEDPAPARPRGAKRDQGPRQQENAARACRKEQSAPPRRGREEMSPEPTERVRCSAPSPEDIPAQRAASPSPSRRAPDVEHAQAEPAPCSRVAAKEARGKLPKVQPPSRAGKPAAGGGSIAERKRAADPGEARGRQQGARNNHEVANKAEVDEPMLTANKARAPAKGARTGARQPGGAQARGRAVPESPGALPGAAVTGRGPAQARQRHVQASEPSSPGIQAKAAEEWEALDREELAVEAASPDIATLLAKLEAKVSKGKYNVV